MKKSRLVLGTTQLGMNYGLNNTSGQPTTERAFKILDAAVENGINTFDTAYAYGNAEDILGEWIAHRVRQKTIFVITKMKPHVFDEYPKGSKAEDSVLAEVEKSLRRLHLDTLDGYLLHTPSYVYEEGVIAGLRIAKERGLVGHIGVSVYDEAEALYAAELGLDYVQIPWNVLDRRMDRTAFWDIAKKNTVTVFARSPFLQGLLIMRPADIPPRLLHAKPHVEKFQAIAKKYHMTPTEAALRYAYRCSKAEHIVFGVETEQQLLQNIAVSVDAGPADWMREIEENFQDIERSVVNPSLWSRKE